MPHLARITLVVCDYDEALAFDVGKLDFAPVEDAHVPDQDKRWVTTRPPGAPPVATTILLARAATDHQNTRIGDQTGGASPSFSIPTISRETMPPSPPPGSNESARPPTFPMAASPSSPIRAPDRPTDAQMSSSMQTGFSPQSDRERRRNWTSN